MMDELQRAIKNCKAMIMEMDFERVDGISALMVKCVKGKALETAISAMQELQEYREIGLTPAQIREIDKLYQEKCKELTEYKKLEERLYDMFEGKFSLSMIADMLEFTLTEPNKPHPVNACILTYEEADKYHKWQELEKQRRLLELPVTAGEKLYWISDEDEDGRKNKTIKDDITAHFVGIGSDGNIYVSSYKLDEANSVLDKLGTRWACATRKDAEKALEEMKNGV